MRLLGLLISPFFLLLSLKALAGNIYIVRHGEAENNIQEVFNSSLGSPPAHLTPTGSNQAKELAFELKKHVSNTALIYCSPLPRTVETAEIIRAELGLINQLQKDPGLIEVDHGNLENKSYRYAEKFGKDSWDISRANLFKGETEEKLEARVKFFLHRILKSNKANLDIIIVTHGNPARYLLKYLDPLKYPNRRLQNCEFAVINKASFLQSRL